MRLNILAFAIGIVCLQMQPELPDWEVWMASGMLILVPRLIRRNLLTKILAAIACIAIGFAWAAWRAEVRLDDHLGTEWEGRDIEVVGVVAGLPQEFVGGTRFEFDVENWPAGVVLPGRLALSWYSGRRDGEGSVQRVVRPGERWRFTVRLKRPHGNANPGAFDYEVWLLERNIRATGYIRPQLPEQITDMVWRPAYCIERARLSIRENFVRILPESTYPYAGVLVALVIGDQRAIMVVV